MLRRFARALRVLSLLAGVVALLAIPSSFFRGLTIISPWPGAYTAVSLLCGGIAISFREENPTMRIDSAVTQFYVVAPQHRARHRLFLPHVRQSQWPAGAGVAKQVDVQVPLWLLAFICLAWPVTSFIVARRRRKGRGFEVEARPGATVPPPDS